MAKQFNRIFTAFILLPLAFTAAFACAEMKLIATVIEQQAHDSKTFTQGLYLHDGVFFESSGFYGQSFIKRYNRKNTIEKRVDLPANIFAEGLTIKENQLHLLTWQSGQLLSFNSETLEYLGNRPYKGEGWGLTHHKDEFIMSNGSDKIFFRDSKSFEIKRTISVHNKWRKYTNINELEYVDGAIWANVWQSSNILKISPKDGEVLGIASLKDLAKKNDTVPQHTVLNGIAFDPEKQAFWITGKFWPNRYLVRFEQQKNNQRDNK